MADSRQLPIDVHDLPSGVDISARAQHELDNISSAIYLQEHFKRLCEPYHPVHRPNGYIPLCVAENKLMFDLLGPKMLQCRDVKVQHTGYDNMIGSMEFRRQMAAFFSKYIVKHK